MSCCRDGESVSQSDSSARKSRTHLRPNSFSLFSRAESSNPSSKIRRKNSAPVPSYQMDGNPDSDMDGSLVSLFPVLMSLCLPHVLLIMMSILIRVCCEKEREKAGLCAKQCGSRTTGARSGADKVGYVSVLMRFTSSIMQWDWISKRLVPSRLTA